MTRQANATVLPYEQALSLSLGDALQEGSMHLGGKGAVHTTAARLAQRLDENAVPYALAGAIALFSHGYRRFTEDVDVLVTPEGLRKIHEQLAGLGYVPLFDGSRNLRDAETGVRIEFLLTGAFPGDGKPKPVAFPEPEKCSVTIEGLKCLSLPALLELKLASGMTSPGRLRDLADVQEVIRCLRLPREFADQMDPYVRPKFHELWDGLMSQPIESP